MSESSLSDANPADAANSDVTQYSVTETFTGNKIKLLLTSTFKVIHTSNVTSSSNFTFIDILSFLDITPLVNFVIGEAICGIAIEIFK